MSSLDSQSPTTSATVHQWRHLANRHQVGWGETLLIALNIHGLSSHGDGPGTIRLKVRPPETEVFQVVIPTGRETSPFTIVDKDLCVDGTPVAEVVDARVDHAVGGYLRAGGRAATIHPYAGSSDAGSPDTREGYSRLLADLAISLPAGLTLADIDEVTVSASAYNSESEAIDDLADLRSAMAGLDMNARIGLLSSVVRSETGMQRLAEEVAPFALFLDADFPGGAEETPLPDVLANARACGHDTSFTYTVGNDPLDVMREQLLPLAQYTTVWPSLFILQTPSSDEDGAHIAEPEQRLDFFLQARTMLERIFAPTPLVPQPWRCYRGLWYREHAGEPLPGPWI
ncbi:hypothetical protein [Stackebrandtia nassauensis]|uniref:Uncharacterized protein n=1 Tax=Stackebrandtia nassauensis (strain DSM 44728 / CIP 108903 / NRRL B-16338 / NBRC 102104 / LLR-40K-21) TaxID=446470 RepID=D3QAT8_STANL|nr:hypothetical protein [Stackebrandtia nassauensis]ADD44734.1 hypothetical protein Snas_5099 [Stackebrandtia nassauensis DSM 44728]